MEPHPTAVSDLSLQTITIKLRLCDKHHAELNRMARAVNVVWNYCNETQKKAALSKRLWLSFFDLQKLTNGASKDLGLHAHTIQRVCKSYADARRAQKKLWLRWRGQKSLGWVPFNTDSVTFDGKSFVFRGVKYQTMHSRDVIVAGAKISAGSFNQDNRGRWYINARVKVACDKQSDRPSIGIDLGLKDFATLSTGEKIASPKPYRELETTLSRAQRARKVNKRIRNIHAKIANRRKDFLHKVSASIARRFGLIVVGDVSPTKLAKTSMAKSVHDAGWSSFKTMLRYKALMHGGRVIEADERYTTQVCSECGCPASSWPKGIAALGIREWTCDGCGTVHDRDVNAARNILRVGLHALVEGAVGLSEANFAQAAE